MIPEPCEMARFTEIHFAENNQLHSQEHICQWSGDAAGDMAGLNFNLNMDK